MLKLNTNYKKKVIIHRTKLIFKINNNSEEKNQLLQITYGLDRV